MSTLTQLARNLVPDELGILRSDTDALLSYPSSGNEECFSLEAGSFWFQHRNRCIAALVKGRPPPGDGEILDVGGGNGVVTAALTEAGFDVTLLEPGAQGALNARRRGVEKVLCSTFEAAGFPDSTIPAIGLFDVVEHIEDDRDFLRRLGTKLVSGGRLYLTVPAYSSLWSDEDVSAGHYRRYTRRSIRAVLNATGFDVDYCGYLFWFLPLPIFALRALPFRLGISGKGGRREQAAREHGVGAEKTRGVLDALLQPELRSIAKGRAIPFGGSCLVSATLGR